LNAEQAVLTTEVLLGVHGAAARRVAADLVMQLVQGRGHQELPQVVAALELVTALSRSGEETATGGLNNILWIDAAGQLAGKRASGQGDHSPGVTVEELAGGGLVAAAPPLKQVEDDVRHSALPLGSPTVFARASRGRVLEILAGSSSGETWKSPICGVIR